MYSKKKKTTYRLTKHLFFKFVKSETTATTWRCFKTFLVGENKFSLKEKNVFFFFSLCTLFSFSIEFVDAIMWMLF